MSHERLYCKTMMTNSAQSLMTQELWVLRNSDMCKLGITWARTYHGVFLNLMAWESLNPSATEVILAREKWTGLLMKGNCLVISVSMQPDVLDRIHDAHQGNAKCRHRGRTSVWWPGLSRQMEVVVKKYPTASNSMLTQQSQRFPLISINCPGRELLLTYLSWKISTTYLSLTTSLDMRSRSTSPDIVVHLSPCFNDTAFQTSHCQTMAHSSQQSGHYTLKRTLPVWEVWHPSVYYPISDTMPELNATINQARVSGKQ